MPQPDKLDPRMEFVAVNWRPFFPRVEPFAWLNACGAAAETERPHHVLWRRRGASLQLGTRLAGDARA